MSLVEMVVAVFLFAGMVSIFLEWVTFQATQRQAAQAAGQIEGLVHLVRSHAQRQPLAWEKGSGRFPPNGLMQDRWPHGWEELLSGGADGLGSMPQILRPWISLPGIQAENSDPLVILGRQDEDITVVPVRRMGMALLQVKGISARRGPAVHRAAALLRRRGLPVRRHAEEDGTLGLTAFLLPLHDVLHPSLLNVPSAGTIELRNSRLDFAYGGQLLVGSIQAKRASAHRMIIDNADAPLDFSFRPQDQAVEKAVADFSYSSAQVRAGLKNLGGYSGFFKAPCDDKLEARLYAQTEWTSIATLTISPLAYLASMPSTEESWRYFRPALPFDHRYWLRCLSPSGTVQSLGRTMLPHSSRLYSRFGYVKQLENWYSSEIQDKTEDWSLQAAPSSSATTPMAQRYSWAGGADSPARFSGSYASNAILGSVNMPQINNGNIHLADPMYTWHRTYRHWPAATTFFDFESIGPGTRRNPWMLNFVPLLHLPAEIDSEALYEKLHDARERVKVRADTATGNSRRLAKASWVSQVLHDLGGGSKEGCFSKHLYHQPQWKPEGYEGLRVSLGPLAPAHQTGFVRGTLEALDYCLAASVGAESPDRRAYAPEGHHYNSYQSGGLTPEYLHKHYLYVPVRIMGAMTNAQAIRPENAVRMSRYIHYDGGIVHSFGGQLHYDGGDKRLQFDQDKLAYESLRRQQKFALDEIYRDPRSFPDHWEHDEHQNWFEALKTAAMASGLSATERPWFYWDRDAWTADPDTGQSEWGQHIYENRSRTCYGQDAHRAGNPTSSEIRLSLIAPHYLNSLLAVHDNVPPWGDVVSPYSDPANDAEKFAYGQPQDYPLARSLCAGTIMAFPLTMTNGVYQIDGAHVYLDEIAVSSDSRLKRDLRPVRAPSGGLGEMSRASLSAHYPQVLRSEQQRGQSQSEPTHWVDANGLIAVVWEEARAMAARHAAEIRQLEAEIDALLCHHFPDQCAAPSATEPTP